MITINRVRKETDMNEMSRINSNHPTTIESLERPCIEVSFSKSCASKITDKYLKVVDKKEPCAT